MNELNWRSHLQILHHPHSTFYFILSFFVDHFWNLFVFLSVLKELTRIVWNFPQRLKVLKILLVLYEWNKFNKKNNVDFLIESGSIWAHSISIWLLWIWWSSLQLTCECRSVWLFGWSDNVSRRGNREQVCLSTRRLQKLNDLLFILLLFTHEWAWLIYRGHLSSFSLFFQNWHSHSFFKLTQIHFFDRTSVHSTITKKGNEQSIDEYWKYKMQRMNNLQNSYFSCYHWITLILIFIIWDHFLDLLCCVDFLV